MTKPRKRTLPTKSEIEKAKSIFRPLKVYDPSTGETTEWTWDKVQERLKSECIDPEKWLRENWPGSYFVYFIEAIGLDRVKIGLSEDPEARLKILQPASPVKLILMGFLPGNSMFEMTLHQQFSQYRLHNEWFLMSRAVRRCIEEWVS